MSFPNDRTYPLDINLLLSDNAAAYTASGWAQVSGAQAILDLGGNQGTTPNQQARMSGVAVCDITAIKTSAGNETYKLMVVGSNDAGLATGNAILGEIELGKGASLDAPNCADSVIGTAEIMFTTNLAARLYEYVGLYLVLAGTAPSINVAARIAVIPEP